MPRARLAAWLLAVVPALAAPARADEAPFYLKDGDRVVFYGDSITDQRLYTTFVEDFVVTRFPRMDVRFIHSGWGGDRVTGGGGRLSFAPAAPGSSGVRACSSAQE